MSVREQQNGQLPVYTNDDYSSLDSAGVYVEKTILRGDFHQHQHLFNETVIIVNGTGTHLLGSHEYPLARGDVFAIKGNISHGFKDVDGMELINLIYDPSFFFHDSSSLQCIPGFIPFFMTEPEVRPLGNYSSMLKLDEQALNDVCMMSDFIISQFKSGEKSLHPVIKFNFMALISYIATKYNSTADTSGDMRILGNAIYYMEKNIDKPISLESIASEVHISSRQLGRLFNKHMDKSPMLYLRDMRMERALTMLTKYNESISLTARKNGFEDPAYFSRIFRSVYGISPQQAKKLLK